MEYAAKLKAYADEAKSDLHIIMRVYFEKCGAVDDAHWVAHRRFVDRAQRLDGRA